MRPDWTIVTAIATIIGVIGGMISLVLLIFEVRRNSRAIEGATVQSLMSFEKDVFTLVADNAALYLKGKKGLAKLKPPERLTFERIVSVQMSLSYSAYVQFQNKLMDDETWDAYSNALHKYLEAPGFKESWKSFEMHYPKSFRDMVNAGKTSQELS